MSALTNTFQIELGVPSDLYNELDLLQCLAFIER